MTFGKLKRRNPQDCESANDGATRELMSPDESRSPSNMSTKTCLDKVKGAFKNADNILVSLTVLSVVLGMGVGLVVKLTLRYDDYAVMLISFPGELLMNMLKMLIIPLIVSSLISGLAGLDPKSSGQIGKWALIYYFSTTMMAVVLGIILVVLIHPGNADIKKQLGQGTNKRRAPSTLDSFLDLLRNIFPPNIIQAAMQQISSKYVNKTKAVTDRMLKDMLSQNKTTEGLTTNSTITYEVTATELTDSTNVLGIVAFSMWFGLVLSQMGEKALIMVQFFALLNEVVMKMVKVIMWYSPIGIFSLVIGKVLQIESLEETAAALGMYMLTVITGLFIHACFTLTLIYVVICRKSPIGFFKGIFQAWITALGTASSAATLPITFRCLEEKIGIDKRVTRFVLPIGATINMDGTALYEAVASIFIAQINARKLEPIQIFTVSITATLAAIGAASVPSAGLVTMIMVLTSVGLPTDDISLILTVDWLLDRLRTSINVLGDAYGAAVVHHLCKKTLDEQDAEILKEAANYLEKTDETLTVLPAPKRLSVALALRLNEVDGQKLHKNRSIDSGVRGNEELDGPSISKEIPNKEDNTDYKNTSV
uniref:Amino acid transporter n=1 Tax=Schmidtea mediterranea TaxID=79327 RepID=A0A0H3YF08_SCHMD|nr:slc1a-2 [Schmidtea mediterranea]